MPHVKWCVRPAVAALTLRLFLAAGLMTGIWGTPQAVTPEESFPRQGTYIYTANELELGREVFTTIAADGIFQIRSFTQLDLTTYLLRQSSTLTVDQDGRFLGITLHGDSGGKEFGLIATVVGQTLVLEDTVQGISTVVDYPAPFHWVSGNFMQHVLHLLSRCDLEQRSRQDIPIQSGTLSIEFIQETWLGDGTADIPVDHFMLTLTDSTMEIFVTSDGAVPIIIIPAQGVRIHRDDAATWTLPVESHNGGRKSNG